MASAVSEQLKTILQEVAEQLHPDDGDFVGRQFVRDYIKRFTTVQNRMLVLVSLPGVGKTALAAALVREHIDDPKPYLAHFCGVNGGDNPFTFCSALGEQLQALLGDGYTLPQTARGQNVSLQATVNLGQVSGNMHVTALDLKIGGMHPREAFRQLVREPLRAYNVAHGGEWANKSLVIVIDALDVAWSWDEDQGGTIVSVLADVQDLPPWVNLICTARPGPAVQALRTQSGVQVFSLDERIAENRNDITTFFHEGFLKKLSDDERTHFQTLVTQTTEETSGPETDQIAAFIARAVDAAENNFRFVRRYVYAWLSILQPSHGHPAADPEALLRFSLTTALNASYVAINERLHAAQQVSQEAEDVLSILAIAFAPLTMELITRISGTDKNTIAAALDWLEPVLEKRGSEDALTYALYHRGFAAYIRQQLPEEGHPWDMRAAQALERADDSDATVNDYSARYRLKHLLRGLALFDSAATSINEDNNKVDPAVSLPAQIASAAQIQEQIHSPVTRAQLLRALAARALDPSQDQVTGSWAEALNCLQIAQQGLWNSRALVRLRKHGKVGFGPPPAELLELERTLIVLGDTYATIAQRMDPGGYRPANPSAPKHQFYLIVNIIARLPLTLYLLLILLMQGVRDVHLRGALLNLGRSQDWTVARLYVLSANAYRRARDYAADRGVADVVDDVQERLARVYTLMGAYDAAAAAYEDLMARPSAVGRQWRQAIWRLELGEVLLHQWRYDQAVEMCKSAQPIFEAQEAPIQRARTFSALATGSFLQANAADARGDDDQATSRVNTGLTNCRDALAAWDQVTSLQGDESVGADPALCKSGVAHQLWRTSQNPRVCEEQQHTALSLLDTVKERHFPQRFELPLLRLFRVAAAGLLPVAVLMGLLLAVQIPSNVQVRLRPVQTFELPLLDLNRYPNGLTDGNSVRSVTLNTDELTQLVTEVDLQIKSVDPSSVPVSAPPLDPSALTWAVLLAVLIYLTVYTVVGLLIIRFSSPAHYQNRCPGRLILRGACLSWRGPPSEGLLIDAWVWLKQDVLGWWTGMRGRTSSTSSAQLNKETTITIGSLIQVNRSAMRHLIYDFSFTVVQPVPRDKQPPIVISGSIVNYKELCADLKRLLKVPVLSFGVELVCGRLGLCFVFTLLYAMLIVFLLPLNPAFLNDPLPGGIFSLSSLYILVTPGLLLPLLWWFVARPLGASSVRAHSNLPLIVTTLASLVLIVVVQISPYNLTPFGLKPDLATPVLANGLLLALVYYAPARPLWSRVHIARANLPRTVLTLCSILGLALMLQQIFITLTWYSALSRGNLLTAEALSLPECADSPTSCEPITQALHQYDQAVCLRPSDGDAYAFRAFAALLQHNYAASYDDFERALGDGPRDPRCPEQVTGTSFAQQRILYGNLGIVEVLLAQQEQSPNVMMQRYQSAIHRFARALDPQPHQDASSKMLDCTQLARDTLHLPSLEGDPSIIDPISSSTGAVNAGNAPIVLQFAYACARSGVDTGQQPTPIINQNTSTHEPWNDLSVAIAAYSAVSRVSTSQNDQLFAQQGLASTWLKLSEFDDLPRGLPDKHTCLLQTLAAFQALDAAHINDTSTALAEAWSAINLHAWDTARASLVAASTKDPRNPIIPAFQGLAAWLEGIEYRTSAPDQYEAATKTALDFYTRVITLSQVELDHPYANRLNLDRAYATRSLLLYNLHGGFHAEARKSDYDIAMRQIISEMDQALLVAERTGVPSEEQIGYHYWRGQLNASLALTWQEQLNNAHSWSEMATLYNSALNDFTEAMHNDPINKRRDAYAESWIPTTHILLANATHIQLAQAAIDAHDINRAKRELALIDLHTVAQRDALSVPLGPYTQLQQQIGMITIDEAFSVGLHHGKAR